MGEGESMINVAICDDEKIQRSIVKEMLIKICEKNNVNIIIDEFSSGKELLDKYKINTRKYNIILCDILMDDLNGIDLIRKIRSINSSFQAIIITGSAEYVFDGYDIGALNYLIKPVSIEKLEKEFIRAVKNINSTMPWMYSVHANGKRVFINISEVLYFEVNNKTITANLEKEKIDFNMKIKELEAEVKDKNFIRCHRSYLVNANKIEEILLNKLILKNKVEIPIGRSYKSEIKNYLLKRANNI